MSRAPCPTAVLRTRWSGNAAPDTGTQTSAFCSERDVLRGLESSGQKVPNSIPLKQRPVGSPACRLTRCLAEVCGAWSINDPAPQRRVISRLAMRCRVPLHTIPSCRPLVRIVGYARLFGLLVLAQQTRMHLHCSTFDKIFLVVKEADRSAFPISPKLHVTRHHGTLTSELS